MSLFSNKIEPPVHISKLTKTTQHLPHFKITIWIIRSPLLRSTLEDE